MKTLLSIFFLLSGLLAKSQIPSDSSYPIKQGIANTPTTVGLTNAMKAADGFINSNFLDTTQANLFGYGGKIKYYAGAQIFVTGENSIYIRNSTATAWIKSSSVGNGSTVRVLTDSSFVVCNINSCDTVVVNSVTVNSVTFLDNTHVVVCDAMFSCDTITIGATPLQQDLQETTDNGNTTTNSLLLGTYPNEFFGLYPNGEILRYKRGEYDLKSQHKTDGYYFYKNRQWELDTANIILAEGSKVKANQLFSGQGVLGDQYHDLTLFSSLFPITTVSPAMKFQVYNTAGDEGFDRIRIYNGDNGKIAINPVSGLLEINNLAYNTGRFETGKGVNVSAANNLTLGLDGNVFGITGATQINAITTANWQAGSVVQLIFASTPTVKHNTAGGAGTATLLLAGAVDFVAGANDVLTLVYDGTNWYETARKVASSGGALLGANNGDTILAGKVGLGGRLIRATDIHLDNNVFTIKIGDTSYFQLGGTSNKYFDNYFQDPLGYFGEIVNGAGVGGGASLYGGTATRTNQLQAKTANVYISSNEGGDISRLIVSPTEIRLESDSFYVGVGATSAGYVLKDVNGNGYATWQPAGGIAGITADNGLTASTATNVQLGGTLINATTTIAAGANNLVITGSDLPLRVAGTSVLLASVRATNSSGGMGFEAVTTTGIGVSSVTSTGTAYEAQTTGGLGFNLSIAPASTNTVVAVGRFSRQSSGTPANGIGGSMEFYNETTGTNRLTNEIISKWTDATDASRTSQMIFTGVLSGATGNLLVLNANKSIQLTPITATAASAITPSEGMILVVSDTDGTFTSVGFWGYSNGAWAKF